MLSSSTPFSPPAASVKRARYEDDEERRNSDSSTTATLSPVAEAGAEGDEAGSSEIDEQVTASANQYFEAGQMAVEEHKQTILHLIQDELSEPAACAHARNQPARSRLRT